MSYNTWYLFINLLFIHSNQFSFLFNELHYHVSCELLSFIEKRADNDDNEVNMDNDSERDSSRGKSGSKNPLAFLGLKRVDIEDEDEDDKKSDDNNGDAEGKKNNVQYQSQITP